MPRLQLVPLLGVLALGLCPALARAQWPTVLGTDLTVAGTAFFSSARAVSDGAGGVITVWLDMRVGGSPTAIYAQRHDADGVRSWAAGGSLVRPDGTAMNEFRACSDDSGGVIVTWPEPVGGASYRVNAQRLDALGQRRWGAAGIRVCTLESNQDYPRIAGDGLGGVVVTWFDGRPGFFSALYAQRLSLSGARLWSGDGVQVAGTDRITTDEIATRADGGVYLVWRTNALVRCGAIDASGAALWANAPVSQQTPPISPPPVAIVADGIGGAVVATEWTGQIFTRRLDSTGALGSPDAILNSGTWGQGDVRLAAGLAGDVFVGWLDGRVALTGQMRVQKLRPDGTQAWLADGELVGPQVTLSNGYHAMVHDGGGGLLAAFSSAFGGRAEHLSGGGAPLWSVHPIVFTTNYPAPPMTLVPTQLSGGILVWQVDLTIKAKRILGNGAITTLDAGPAATPATTQLAPPSPNPSRHEVALRFVLASASDARLTIHDAQGRQVCRVAAGERAAGWHTVSWSGHDEAGTRVAPGLYFARLEAAGVSRHARLVVLQR